MQEPGGESESGASSSKFSAEGSPMISEAKGFASTYWDKARLILGKPNQFFDSMATEGGFAEPLKFLSVVAGVNAVMTGLLSGFNLVLIFIVFPASLIGTSLGALIANFLAQTMKGKGTFEGTFRVMSYSEAPLLFAWIPVVGIAAILYTWVLNYIGLKKVHGLSEIKTVAVVLLSGIVAAMVLGLAACGLFLKSLLKF